jgi:hypothetical protein
MILIGTDTGDVLTRKAPWHPCLIAWSDRLKSTTDCDLGAAEQGYASRRRKIVPGTGIKWDNASASKVQAVALAQARPSIFEALVALPRRRASSYLAGTASVMRALAAAVARPFAGSAAATRMRLTAVPHNLFFPPSIY